MMSDTQEKDDERFLTRWSRRKVEARRADPEDGPLAAPAAAAAPSGMDEPPESAASDAPLPTIEELRGLESEYRDFLRPGVDETLRRAALSKLFRDPHFNIMDGLDTYIDDYTKADPISEDVLKTLNQAKGLIFDRESEHGPGEATRADAGPAPASPLASPQVSSVSSTDQDQTDADDAARSGRSRPGTSV